MKIENAIYDAVEQDLREKAPTQEEILSALDAAREAEVQDDNVIFERLRELQQLKLQLRSLDAQYNALQRVYNVHGSDVRDAAPSQDEATDLDLEHGRRKRALVKEKEGRRTAQAAIPRTTAEYAAVYNEQDEERIATEAALARARTSEQVNAVFLAKDDVDAIAALAGGDHGVLSVAAAEKLKSMVGSERYECRNQLDGADKRRVDAAAQLSELASRLDRLREDRDEAYESLAQTEAGTESLRGLRGEVERNTARNLLDARLSGCELSGDSEDHVRVTVRGIDIPDAAMLEVNLENRHIVGATLTTADEPDKKHVIVENGESSELAMVVRSAVIAANANRV